MSRRFLESGNWAMDKMGQTLGWFVVAAMAVIGLSACSDGRAPINEALVRDSAGITIVQNGPIADLPRCGVSADPELLIGSSSGDPEQEFYRIFGVTRLTDGTIAVVNQGSSEVRIYDAEGQHVRSFGSEGEGPGEFRRSFLIWSLPGDTLWVGDYSPWRFLVFTAQGEWIRTVVPEPRYLNSPADVGVMADGYFLFGLQERDFEGTAFRPSWLHAILHGPEGNLVDTLDVLQYGSYGLPEPELSRTWIYPFFQAFSQFEVGGRHIFTTTGEHPEVKVLDRSGQLVRKIQWIPVDRRVTSADLELAKDEWRSRFDQLDPEMRERAITPGVSPNRPHQSEFPAVRNLRVGEDGRLWVQRYQRPGQSEERWLRFDTEGRLECEAITPPQLEEYEFGADYILGTERDDLGVERVALYGLTPPVSRD